MAASKAFNFNHSAPYIDGLIVILFLLSGFLHPSIYHYHNSL